MHAFTFVSTPFAGLAILFATALHAQDKYSLKSPSGIAFSDFKGYEDWAVDSSAQTNQVLKVIVASQSQPKVSRHLAYLRRAGIVAARREGKWMHYSIVAPKHAGAARILSETLSVLNDDSAMRADTTKLNKACCVPQRVSALEGPRSPFLSKRRVPVSVELMKSI